jgi:DNA-binding transcriptional LysR family regulator
MRPDIQAMGIFVRAVETNSFVGAARSLLIDPAAVSRSIKALETDLDVLLFVRSTRAMKLTAEGAQFYRGCVEILKKLDQVTQQFHGEQGMARGQLKIGMASGLTRRIMLRAIPEFQKQYSAIEIVLLNIDDLAEIENKGIDILVRPGGIRQHGGPRAERQGLVVRKLAQSRFVVCASPEYLKRAGVPRVPADLLRHACVALVSVERDVHNEWKFVKSQVHQKVRFVPKLLVQSNDAMREAGLAGCGIVRISAYHAEDELCARTLLPVLPNWECLGSRPIVAIYRKTRPMPPQISLFVRHLEHAFKRYNLPAPSTG